MIRSARLFRPRVLPVFYRRLFHLANGRVLEDEGDAMIGDEPMEDDFEDWDEKTQEKVLGRDEDLLTLPKPHYPAMTYDVSFLPMLQMENFHVLKDIHKILVIIFDFHNQH